MTDADYTFFQDYADAFRQRHGYTGHRTVYLRHQVLEAVMMLQAMLRSLPKKQRTAVQLRELAARLGNLRSQHLKTAKTERERIHGKLWAELSSDEDVLRHIFALRLS